MSFITDAFSWITGSSLGAKLARTAATGFVLNRVTNSINKENAAAVASQGETIDAGTRVQINPNTSSNIPVAYGEYHTGGTIIDAHQSADKLKITVAIVISEKTGTVYSTNIPSVTGFFGVFINDIQVNFQADGITASGGTAPDGTIFDNWNNLIKIYLYDGNSETPRAVIHKPDTQATLPNAYDVFPTWDDTYMMENLVFAICEVTYNAEKEVRGLPEFKFHLNNTMYQPGDCLYDYMTNDLYGAGIDADEIRTI
jgi:hypothetical protein